MGKYSHVIINAVCTARRYKNDTFYFRFNGWFSFQHSNCSTLYSVKLTKEWRLCYKTLRMKSKVHQVRERQIELNNMFDLWNVIVRDFNDNILFSAIYLKYQDALAAYRLAYNCIVSDISLERIYGEE